ncbi:MAG: VOC family protein [Panacibacter sp.]
MKKVILLITVVVFTTKLEAQDSIAFNFTFNHMALSVKDLDASAGFYKKVFQFTEITNRSKIEGIRWLSTSEGKELHLISIIKENVTPNKALHLAFTTQNFDAFVSRLQTMNIAYSDWPGTPQGITKRADGVKQIYFQDPDGYWIEVNNGYAAVESTDQIKNEIWQKEENYWKYVKAQDLQSYLTLWDEKFIGYPANNIIGNKDHITDWITELFKDKGRIFNYELNRNVENVFGDIVIVLYDVNYIWTNEKNEIVSRITVKITHTWKKTDKGWLIIGGMGANK